MQVRNDAPVQSPSPGRLIYVVRVHNRDENVETWASIVAEGMAAGEFTDEGELAAAIGTNRTTVWRWLHRGKRPANVPTIERFSTVTGIDLNRSLRAAGFAPQGAVAVSAPRVPPGFNASDPIVRKILAADVDEQTREEMFRHYRRRLDEAKADIDWMTRHARGA